MNTLSNYSTTLLEKCLEDLYADRHSIFVYEMAILDCFRTSMIDPYYRIDKLIQSVESELNNRKEQNEMEA